ncbi:MAG: DUF1223 domain-containing protein [Betaproteobacteria bacterium]|nr:DUF1223 domain-containing protein [Betaproteobacteria bacterium]MDH5341750.1 DUF1223 domain-containing protein [Betaproteobacteria bacterium]
MYDAILRATALCCTLMLLSPASWAAGCSAASGNARIPLLELYTSEGCDSCPPTDQWVSTLPQRGYTTARVVTLAFHVDYWNYLGWTDPYAQAAFSARQRESNRRNRARVVYTPQLILDGADYRRALFRDDFGERVAAVNKQKPRAHIHLAIAGSASKPRLQGRITVPAMADRDTAGIYVAVYENGLTTDVRSGENRGKKLAHDFVVREMTGPLALDAAGIVSFERPLPVPGGGKTARLHVAAFAQDRATGTTLQALALPYCLNVQDISRQ